MFIFRNKCWAFENSDLVEPSAINPEEAPSKGSIQRSKKLFKLCYSGRGGSTVVEHMPAEQNS